MITGNDVTVRIDDRHEFAGCLDQSPIKPRLQKVLRRPAAQTAFDASARRRFVRAKV
jgi:hypothetical protein